MHHFIFLYSLFVAYFKPFLSYNSRKNLSNLDRKLVLFYVANFDLESLIKFINKIDEEGGIHI